MVAAGELALQGQAGDQGLSSLEERWLWEPSNISWL